MMFHLVLNTRMGFQDFFGECGQNAEITPDLVIYIEKKFERKTSSVVFCCGHN